MTVLDLYNYAKEHGLLNSSAALVAQLYEEVPEKPKVNNEKVHYNFEDVMDLFNT